MVHFTTMESGDSLADPAPPAVLAIFTGRQDTFGMPHSPTQKGLLALARAGAEVWNGWRSHWPAPRVDFTGVNFALEMGSHSFSGFSFGDNASFDDAQFGDHTRFEGTQFGHGASFERARFGRFTSFEETRFGTNVWFRHTQFGERASFARAQFSTWARFEVVDFGDGASFDGVRFGDNVRFTGSQFGHMARFTAVEFGADAVFTGIRYGNKALFVGAHFDGFTKFSDAVFGEHVAFNGSQFNSKVEFDGALFGSNANFAGTQLGNDAVFDHAQFGTGATFAARDQIVVDTWWCQVCPTDEALETRRDCARQSALRSDAFRRISFRGVQFRGSVSFQNREFLESTDFGPSGGTPTRFYGVPNFHGCLLHQDTSFEDTEFRARPTREGARAYRTLKLAMAQQHAIREEQRFFRLEMDAEGASTTRGGQWLFASYKAVSNYGFSLLRPFLFWVICLVTFAMLHGMLSGPSALHTGLDRERTAQWAEYVLLNAIPLPGFDKIQMDLRTQLFSGSQATMLAVVIADMVHEASALVAVFLAGLALRNLFKMKG